MSNPRNERFDVIQPGISISSKNSRNGTIGLIVFDRKNDYQACILSNWHVLGAKRPKRFRWSLKPGAVAYQPGKINQGKDPNNIMAVLVRRNWRLDCAISRITKREYKLEQYETGVTITKTRVPKVDDIVEKSGVKTGVTRAKVKAVNGNWVHLVPVKDGNPEGEEISMGGDSGSVWYDPETHEGLILHSEGDVDDSPNVETASGLILGKVLDFLEVSLTPKK